MKTKEELNELKEEVETLDEKLHELTEEELAQVTGGIAVGGLTPGGAVGGLTPGDALSSCAQRDIGTITGAVGTVVVAN